MNFEVFFGSQIFKWVILPLLIFTARIFDVSLGTIRIVFISKGFKYLAPILGFFEVFIWLLAIGQIMQNLNNVFCYIAYAGGFAMGNFVGMHIEKRMAIGSLIIRIITNKDSSELISFLKSKNYGITSIEGHGIRGKVHLLYMIVRRTNLEDVIGIIEKFNPKAFYSIEDVRSVREGIFPIRKSYFLTHYKDLFRFRRKGK